MVAQDRDKPCPYGKMDKFPGFSDQETFTQVPDSFFRKLLNEIDEADELKVTLYAIWRMAHMEGHTRFLRAQDFAEIVPDPASALEKAVSRGSLIGVEKKGKFFFLNSPRGRAVADSFAKDQWEPGDAPSVAPRERPNVFKLYEENIGPQRRRADVQRRMGGRGNRNCRQEQQTQLEVRGSDFETLEGGRSCQKAR
jgi:hypothetical protein